MSSERNLKIDFLRVLGIHLVVLAHINNVPKVLLEIREFDVVLLVFLSGFVYTKSSCFQHVLKRAKRLLIPSYLAISAAYCMILFSCIIGHVEIRSFSYFSPEIILQTLTFQNGGIGYVWIVRIFLMLAVLSGPIYGICTRIKFQSAVYMLMIAGLIAQEYLVSFFSECNNLFVHQVLLYVIPYSLVYFAGMYTKREPKSTNRIMLLMLFLYFTGAFLNKTLAISPYKYPPRLLYTVYGLFCTCLLFRLASPTRRIPDCMQKMIIWFSKNSMNIYYVHILPVIAIKLLQTRITAYIPELNNWIIQYLVVLLISVGGWCVIEKCILIWRERKI